LGGTGARKEGCGLRISIARPFQIVDVNSDNGAFGKKDGYDVLAIGVIDPASEELSTDFKKRTRLLVADDGGHLVWVSPDECKGLVGTGS
jgi:hypothetical protein